MNRIEKGAPRRLGGFGYWLVGGFVVGAAVAQLDLIDTFFDETSGSRSLAALLAALYLFAGVVTLVGLAMPALGVRLKMFASIDEARSEMRFNRAGAIAALLMGSGMLVLLAAAPVGPLAPPAAAAMLALVIAVTAWTFRRQLLLADELMHSVIHDAAARAYYLMLAVGGGWALVAYLGFLPEPRALDWINLFYLLALVASALAMRKRGLLEDEAPG